LESADYGGKNMVNDPKPDIDDFMTITKALSDPHRVRALLALRKGEMCVCQLIELFGLAPSTVSKHMSILKQAGLVSNRKDNRWVYYRLVEDANSGRVCEIVKLIISFLKQDEQIRNDDIRMVEITSEGLDSLCRRQRNNFVDPQKGSVGLKKLKILFLCTGNSCRSQMAEGWARHLKSDEIEPYSAGIETHGLNPNAVRVMAEAGVDISLHRSKHLDEVKDIPFDWVITVCDNANESCPIFPGNVKRFHISFDDPPRLSKNAKDEDEMLEIYRRVRDDIRRFIEGLPLNLSTKEAANG
jgi:arsenate reductase